MLKRKCCEHPEKHANSTRAPKGTIAVSLQLSKFLVSRYNLMETRTRWLCPRCHAFESKEMTAYQTVQIRDNEVSSDDGDDDDALMIEIPDTLRKKIRRMINLFRVYQNATIEIPFNTFYHDMLNPLIYP